MMIARPYRFGIVLIMFFTACNPYKKVSQDYTYFQRGLDSLGQASIQEVEIQPNDLLSIQVFSKTLNQEQAALFNIPNIGAGTANGYLVDVNGNIELPIIGAVKASGLSRSQLSTELEKKLMPYVKEPSVLVRFLQFRVNVLGEVRTPGSYNFSTDRVTLFDALSAAGDLTEDAKRNGVVVIREEKGTRNAYPVDLRSAATFQSPVFQLHQNDVVYVGPNAGKLAIVKSNPNTQKNVGIALSLASIALLIFNIFKK